jgi:hypothetical protein
MRLKYNEYIPISLMKQWKIIHQSSFLSSGSSTLWNLYRVIVVSAMFCILHTRISSSLLILFIDCSS